MAYFKVTTRKESFPFEFIVKLPKYKTTFFAGDHALATMLGGAKLSQESILLAHILNAHSTWCEENAHQLPVRVSGTIFPVAGDSHHLGFVVAGAMDGDNTPGISGLNAHKYFNVLLSLANYIGASLELPSMQIIFSGETYCLELSPQED